MLNKGEDEENDETLKQLKSSQASPIGALRYNK